MAGQPTKRRVVAVLHDWARREFGDETPATQDEAVLAYLEHRVESGDTLLKVAKEVGREIGLDVRRAVLSKWLTQAQERLGREEPGGLLARARARGAAAMADEALEILDEADTESREALQKAQMRANQRNWLAERMDRDTFGQKSTTNVSISFAGLHLEAMQQMRALPNASDPNEYTQLPSGEVVVEQGT